jgi:hypothetical protein
MHSNLIVCLLAAGFSGYLKPLGWKSVIPSQERLSPENEVAADDKVVGPDAYKIAVMVLVGATILSVCL